MFQTIENPNSDKLKISGIKYSSDNMDKSIPKPLPQGVFFMYLCGRPKSGKSCFLINLIAKRGKFYNKKFDLIYVFSPSLFSGNLEKNPFDQLPDEQKFRDLDNLEEVVQSLYGSEEKILMIFDDIQHELKLDKLNTFLHLIQNRRHYTTQGISIILTSQCYIGSVDLKIRKNISNLVLWPSKNTKELKAVHQEYLSFLTFEKFMELTKYIWKEKNDFIFLDTYEAQDKMIYDSKFNSILLLEK